MKRSRVENREKMKRIRSVNRKYLPAFIAVVSIAFLAVLLSVLLTVRYTQKAVNDHARMGTAQAQSNLYTVFDSGFELLDAMAAQQLSEVEPGNILDNISYSSFSDAFSNYHLMTVSENRYIVYGDGRIQLSVQYEPGKVVMGEIASERIVKALNSTYSEPVGYALFDTKTGLFILENSFFKTDNYYDGLLELNNNRSVTEMLNNEVSQVSYKAEDGQVYIIAQSIRKPCGIVLIIPRYLLGNIGSSDYVAMMPGLLGAILLLLALIGCMIISALYSQSLYSFGAGQTNGWRELAETAAHRGNFAIFAIKCRGREADEIFYFFNALPIPEEETIPVDVVNLRGLEDKLRVDSAENGKLAAVISGMKGGDYVETDLHCILPTGVQCLHFELHRDPANTDNVIGCVYDTTEDEQLRRTEVSESEFIENMRPRSEYIWHINAVRNTWKAIYSRNSRRIPVFGKQIEVKRSYDEDLRELLREYFHPDDYIRFAEMMTSDALKKAFNEGKTEFRSDYRVTIDKGADWSWIRFVVRIWKNPTTRDIKADVFAINVNEQKKAEIERRERSDVLSRSLKAVNGMFFGLFYVDIVTGLCYSAKPYRGETGLLFVASFTEIFSKYITDFVHPDDRKSVKEMMDLWHIRKKMVEDTHLMQLRYRSLMGDEYYWSVASIQAAQFENGSITKVVVTLQHIHLADTSRMIAE